MSLHRPTAGRFEYDRAELWADGIIHGLGIVLGVIAVAGLVGSLPPEPLLSDLLPILIYSIAMLTVLSISAAYNMWPLSPVKWWLRRFDHAAIFLLIAGTYTPFLTRMSGAFLPQTLMVLVRAAAVVGIILKIDDAGALRSLFDHSLPFDRLERHRPVGRYPSISDCNPLAARRWGGAVHERRHLSRVGEPSFPKCDLACLGSLGDSMPLWRGAIGCRFTYRMHSGLSQSKVQFARAIPTPSLNRSDKEASFSSVAQVAHYPLANGDLRPKHLTIDNHGDLPNMTTVVILGERGHIMQEVQLKDAKASLSAIVDRAAAGEEIVITRHGRKEAVLISWEEFRRLSTVPSFGKLLMSAPIEAGDIPERHEPPHRSEEF